MTQKAPSELMRVKRAHQRGAYDAETINMVLDAGFICHVGYVIDGSPLVTPTAYWRVDDAVYVHGSSASRMIRTLGGGASMAFTVSIMDGLVMARSAFEHSINYRGVMATGTGFPVEEPGRKTELLRLFMERLAPGRWDQIRQPSAQELKSTGIVGLKLDNATAKIHTDPVTDLPEDVDIPVWAGVIPVKTQNLPPLPDKDMDPRLSPPSYLNVCPIHAAKEG